MAKDKKAAKEAPAVETAEKGSERNYPKYLDKEPTDLQSRFADWMVDKTGLTFGTKKEEALYRKAVALAVYLRIPFQESPENQAVLAEQKAAVAAKKAAPKKAEKSTAKKSKAPAQAEAPAEEVTEEAPVAEKKAPAKRASAKKAPEAPAETAEAPAEEAPAKTTRAAKASPKRPTATKSKAPF